MLEQITLEPWEHSASENLFIRKLHYERKRTAGYSFWPMGGWDAALERDGRRDPRPAAARSSSAPRSRRSSSRPRRQGRRLKGGEELEAAEVVVNAPVWDLNRLFADDVLPWDFTHRVKSLARQPEPGLLVRLLDRRRGAGDRDDRARRWRRSSPRRGPACPASRCTSPATTRRSRRRASTSRASAPRSTRPSTTATALDTTASSHELWQDIEEMMPAAKGALWKKPHLVNTYGVICKPGQVGRRPAGHGRARRRRPLADRRHDPRARDRHRQGRALGHHHGRDGPRRPRPRSSPTRCATSARTRSIPGSARDSPRPLSDAHVFVALRW